MNEDNNLFCEDNVIKEVNFEHEMMCPYRTHTVGFQQNNNGVIEAHQLAKFMPCYGASCPYYNDKRCMRADADVGLNIVRKRR